MGDIHGAKHMNNHELYRSKKAKNPERVAHTLQLQSYGKMYVYAKHSKTVAGR